MDRPIVDAKRTNLPAKAVQFESDPVGDYHEPGSYEIAGTSHVLLACPGCGYVTGMRIGFERKPERSPSWLATLEDDDTLTLEPSINCVSCCGWHGYLKRGLFTC